MPTRKINNENEAAEAFSDRAFFRVGDRFISPDEIISARRITNGVQFTLSDGSTVTHDRFQKGSIGHFLFEQLSKVEGRFSETLKPEFTDLVSQTTLYSQDSEILATLSGGGLAEPSGERIDTQNGVIVGGENGFENGSEIRVWNLSDGSVKTTVTPNNNGSGGSRAADPLNQQVFAQTHDDSAGQAYLERVDYDGQNLTQLGQVGALGGGFTVQTNAIDVLPSESVGMVASNDDLFRFDFSGSNITNLGLDAAHVAADRENKVFYVLDFNGTLRKMDPGGTEISTQSASWARSNRVDGVGFTYNNGKIYGIDTDNTQRIQSAKVTDANNETTVVELPSSTRSLDIAFKASRV